MKRWLLCFVVSAGCGGASDDTLRDVALTDLTCSSLDPATGVWESASFPAVDDCGVVDAGAVTCCAWVELPAHTKLRVEHGLGRVPRVVDPWIAFTEYGSGATLGSGDALRLRAADETFVTVQNHTDQRFYLRLDLR